MFLVHVQALTVQCNGNYFYPPAERSSSLFARIGVLSHSSDKKISRRDLGHPQTTHRRDRYLYTYTLHVNAKSRTGRITRLSTADKSRTASRAAGERGESEGKLFRFSIRRGVTSKTPARGVRAWEDCMLIPLTDEERNRAFGHLRRYKYMCKHGAD